MEKYLTEQLSKLNAQGNKNLDRFERKMLWEDASQLLVQPATPGCFPGKDCFDVTMPRIT